MQTFPTLFKKTSTGAIQQWSIQVDKNRIITTHGQVGGKLQTVEDVVKEGKNAGRSNATTPAQQAAMEAEARHLRQKKKGYVTTPEAAQAGETDDVIEGGVVPMLAKSFDEAAAKIKYPAAVQPKLDGHRCVAMVDKNGNVTLWTRSRKPITSVPHIVEKLQAMGLKDVILDGELYNHDLKSDFERISSMVRQEEPHPECTIIQYHVYDMVSMSEFRIRNGYLRKTVKTCEHIVLVETGTAANAEAVARAHDVFVEKGYEGAMVRNLESPYENKRSAHLQKVKVFKDAEFKIVALEEGRGKLMGHAGSCTCELPDGRKFSVKMSGSTAELKKAWENPKLWVGKMLTVQFQNYTSAGMPRFPVGLRLREDE